MKTDKIIDLAKLSTSGPAVEKLAAALDGKGKVDWTRHFAASGKRPTKV
jgi:hypothetical protein